MARMKAAADRPVQMVEPPSPREMTEMRVKSLVDDALGTLTPTKRKAAVVSAIMTLLSAKAKET